MNLAILSQEKTMHQLIQESSIHPYKDGPISIFAIVDSEIKVFRETFFNAVD